MPIKTGKTCALDDASVLTACDEIECIVEATGHPIAGVPHEAWCASPTAANTGIMVNVEADCALWSPCGGTGLSEEPRRTAWPTATNRPSSANWWIGCAPAASS